MAPWLHAVRHLHVDKYRFLNNVLFIFYYCKFLLPTRIFLPKKSLTAALLNHSILRLRNFFRVIRLESYRVKRYFMYKERHKIDHEIFCP